MKVVFFFNVLLVKEKWPLSASIHYSVSYDGDISIAFCCLPLHPSLLQLLKFYTLNQNKRCSDALFYHFVVLDYSSIMAIYCHFIT